jgi:hypothetical protein
VRKLKATEGDDGDFDGGGTLFAHEHSRLGEWVP